MTFHCSNRHQQSSESAYGSRQHMQNHWAEDGEGCLCHVLREGGCARSPGIAEDWLPPAQHGGKKGKLWECRGKGRSYGTLDAAPWAHPVGISRICVLPHVPPSPHTLTGASAGDPALQAAPTPCGRRGTWVLARMLHMLKYFTELELYSACLLS